MMKASSMLHDLSVVWVFSDLQSAISLFNDLFSPHLSNFIVTKVVGAVAHSLEYYLMLV